MIERLLLSDRMRRLGALAVFLGVAVAVAVAARRLAWVDTIRHQEVIAYRVASQALADGVPVPTFYDDDAFWRLTQERGLESKNIFYPNPPLAAVLHLPFVKLDFVAARRAHLAVSVLSALLALGILCRTLSLSPVRCAVLGLALFFLQPFWADLTHGQVYSLGTLLLAGSFALGTQERRGAAWLGGALAAAPLVFKVYGAFVPLAAPRGRVRPFLLGHAATALGFVICFLPFVGVPAWAEFLGPVRARVGADPTLVATAFSSLTGLLARLTTRDPRWNPHGLLDAPALARALQVAAVLALAFVVLRLRREGDPRFAFAAAILVGILASPFSQDYTYVAVLVPCALLLSRLSARDLAGASLFAAGMVLVGWDSVGRVTRFQDGLPTVLAYPKVLGALLLLAALSRAQARELAGGAGERQEPARL